LTLIVERGKHSFIILNRFPYTSGHVMIVPYAHVAELGLCSPETLREMMESAQRVEKAYQAEYKPDGMNLGMNLGRAAGAGVTGHLHLHALPRWFGDSNFMTVTGETRVHPEDLAMTYQRLKKALRS
jgi:ATP adenylyltransferase